MAFTCYISFHMDDMPFEKVKGRDMVDIVMMKAIGIVQYIYQGYRLTPILGEQQLPSNVEEEEEEVDDMVE